MADFSSSGLAFFAFVIIFTVICGIVLLLRLWAARVSGRSLYLDDGFILFAYANAIALGGVGLWAAVNGVGKPGIDLSAFELHVNAKLVLTSDICWLLASVFVKMSILWLYSRIFATAHFRRRCWALMVINAFYGIAFLIVYLTNCEPVDQLWNPSPNGHCRDMQISDYATVGINMILDLSILILPLPTLWGLQLPVRKKVTVTIMLSFGIATIAVMIWRITATVKYRADPDFTRHLGLIGLISFFEIWFGIIVACIPTLAPLFQTYFKPLLSKMSDSAGSGPHALSDLHQRIPDHDKLQSPMYGEFNSQEQLAPNTAFTTKIVSARQHQSTPSMAMGSNVIHVRSDIESQSKEP